ncbi:MAG: cyclase family protein [Saprospiraceae bacterium]|nr:cyclase family protein [Saprospiraceae bacterium]
MSSTTINPADYKVIDLTLPFQMGMSGFRYEIAKTIEADGWNARDLNFYSHAGTHMDAPLHFGVNDRGIDTYAVDRFFGRAWVIRIPIHEPQQLISVADLGMVSSTFNTGDSLLLNTKWDQYAGEVKYRDELPRISEDLARWCVDHEVNMLGVEAPSIADVNNLEEVTMIHKILLGGDVIIIEGLTHLDRIQREEVMLLAFPLKIKGSDGSPARVIALEKI